MYSVALVVFVELDVELELHAVAATMTTASGTTAKATDLTMRQGQPPAFSIGFA